MCAITAAASQAQFAKTARTGYAPVGRALKLARRQGAALFELRAALDDDELRGQPARAALIDVASRIPVNNAWPELARAQASLSEHSPRT